MSDNSAFGGAGTAVADQPPVEAAEDARRVTPVMVVVAVAVVLALGVAAYFLLFSGGGEEPSGSVVTPGQPAASAPPSPGASATTAPTAVATAPAAAGRDPFAPLAVPVASAATTDVPGSSAAPSAGSSSGVSAPAGVTQVVALKGVSTASGSATVTVNSKSYIAHLGETFGTYFQLRGVSSSCGYFLYGDMSFQLCGTQKVTLKS